MVIMEKGNHDTTPPPEITLRRFEPSSEFDFATIMELFNDQRVSRFLNFEPFAGRDDVSRFVENYILPHPWFRFICLAGGGGRPVGSVVLRPEDAGGGRRRVSIGYSIFPEFWGRGIATATVKMVAAAAFEEWIGVERVQAMMFPDNAASQRVLEKAGFVREALMRRYFVCRGEARDVVMYGFIPTTQISKEKISLTPTDFPHL